MLDMDTTVLAVEREVTVCDAVAKLGEQALRLREAKGLIQRDIAALTGNAISDSYYSKFERGLASPDIEVLIKIFNVLGRDLKIKLREQPDLSNLEVIDIN